MERKITDDIKIVYFTIGFISNFTSKNLIKIPIPERNYPSFHYYKAELSLEVMDMFPEENNFIFTDTDILFSNRVDFNKLAHNHPYPLGVFGPHEYPWIWERVNGEMIIYNETKLMNYMNVPERTIMYQWSCFYVFNRSSYDFFEEYTAFCKNQYLIKRRKEFYPFHDETSFNVCLWKRNATHSLGYVFVNTHILDTVKLVEENLVQNSKLGKNLDQLGGDWEYVHDSKKVILYHGFKDEESTKEVLNYLLSRP
jgi:hypothetical protein